MAYLTKQQVKQMIGDLSAEHSPEDVVNSLVKQGHTLEGFDEQKEAGSIEQLATGFVKGAGRSAIDLVEQVPLVEKILNPGQAIINKLTGNKSLIEKTISGVSGTKPVGEAKKFLEPKTQLEKVGGYVETGAEILIPSTLIGKAIKTAGRAKNALTLDTKALAKLSSGKFKKIFNLEKGELEKAGGLKDEFLKMPKKAEELATEFKDILVSSKPGTNLKNAKKAGEEYWKKTLDLFEGENKTLNEKTIRAYLKKSISDKISFDSPFQRKEILDKTIEPFMKNVKSGTLKGLEEARAKLSTISRDSKGALKPAIDELNKAVKNVIRENLPEAKQIAYDAYKVKMAKLFDVRDILKAKNLVLKKGLIKEVGKKALQGAGVAGAYYGLKSLFK